MLKIGTYLFVLMATIFLPNGFAFAENSPTIDQVYQSAKAGRLDEAQRMMGIVIKEHPNSAKAHFVEAELLAKQGLMARADAELNAAQKLKPDLSFASPQAVQDLISRIALTNQVSQTSSAGYQTSSGSNIPWGMILLGFVAIVLITLFMRNRSISNAATYPGNYPSGMQNTSASPMSTQAYAGGTGNMATGGGIGSGIMAGLATGAAVGVGMVAGEALAHHFMDGGHSVANNSQPVADTWGGSSNDMGGADFGIADNAAWDDGSKIADGGSDVGGSDWS
jgi:hypothetical protein